MGLFIAIDEKLIDGSYVVVFTVHTDRYAEASSLIPLLCIVMEAKYGPQIWDWFTDDAKPITAKYKWDPAEDKVMPLDPDEGVDEDLEMESDDEYMKSICSLLNVDDDHGGQGFEFDIHFLVAEIARSKNQYGDSGSIKTFRSACKASVDDSEQLTDASDSHDSVYPPGDSSGLEQSLSKLMLAHPDLVQKLLEQQSLVVSAPPASQALAVSPASGVDGN
jgi:hypothetical protein